MLLPLVVTATFIAALSTNAFAATAHAVCDSLREACEKIFCTELTAAELSHAKDQERELKNAGDEAVDFLHKQIRKFNLSILTVPSDIDLKEEKKHVQENIESLQKQIQSLQNVGFTQRLKEKIWRDKTRQVEIQKLDAKIFQAQAALAELRYKLHQNEVLRNELKHRLSVVEDLIRGIEWYIHEYRSLLDMHDVLHEFLGHELNTVHPLDATQAQRYARAFSAGGNLILSRRNFSLHIGWQGHEAHIFSAAEATNKAVYIKFRQESVAPQFHSWLKPKLERWHFEKKISHSGEDILHLDSENKVVVFRNISGQSPPRSDLAYILEDLIRDHRWQVKRTDNSAALSSGSAPIN